MRAVSADVAFHIREASCVEMSAYWQSGYIPKSGDGSAAAVPDSDPTV
jgi:hypothetical protein